MRTISQQKDVEQWKIRDRSHQYTSRAKHRPLPADTYTGPEVHAAEQQRASDVQSSRHSEVRRNKTNRYQQKAGKEDLSHSPLACGVDDGEHPNAGAAVIFAI